MPTSEGVLSSGANGSTAAAVMYNMIQGSFCPDELVAAGTMNSMLGEVTGRQYPLRFGYDAEGAMVVSGAFGSAKVLNKTLGCQSVVLLTDVPLLPPLDSRDTEAVPTLPTLPIRHLFCNPPSVKSSNESTTPPDPPSQLPSSSSSTLALALGLGVGLSLAAIVAGLLYYRCFHRPRVGGHIGIGAMDHDKERVTPSISIETSSEDFGEQGAASSAGIPTAIDFYHNSTGGLDAALTIWDADIVTENPRPSAQGVLSRQLSRLASNECSVVAWEIDPHEVEIAVNANGQPVLLGQGTFGAVYAGKLRGVQSVAIKVLDSKVGVEAEAAFQREAAILMHINRDRNVIQLYGTSKMPDGSLLILTELVEGGDLRQALSDPEKAEALAWHRAGKGVALDISRGLTTIHAVKVIHRDLKSKNVFLTKDFLAKIGDVGIAAVHSQGYLTASAGQFIGTLAWSAPELLMNGRCTEKADIYSFGVVLWELATGKIPERGFIALPDPSEACPTELATLIQKCLSYDPDDRPTAKEAYEMILNLPPLL